MTVAGNAVVSNIFAISDYDHDMTLNSYVSESYWHDNNIEKVYETAMIAF